MKRDYLNSRFTFHVSRSSGSTRVRAVILIVGVMTGLALPLLLNTLISSYTLTDTLATSVDPSLSDSISGFFDTEVAPDGTTYRWTTSHAIATFPYAANLGRYALIVVRIADSTSEQSTKPAVLRINGGPPHQVDVKSTFQTYTFSLDVQHSPNRYLDPANIQVDIETATHHTVQDPRDLGVAVDYIQLQMHRGTKEVVLEVILWTVSLLIVLLIAFSRFGSLWTAIYCISMLATFSIVHLTYVPRTISLPVVVALIGMAWIIGTALAPSKYPLVGVYIAVLGLWLVSAGRLLGEWQVDDAYISYRYAYNLVSGHGLVYNPGEVVEGYTNFLWTMLAAGGLAFSLQPPGLMLTASIAASLVILCITFQLAAKLTGGKNWIWPALACGLLVVDPDLLIYGTRGSGIEAAAFAMFTLYGIALLWSAPNVPTFQSLPLSVTKGSNVPTFHGASRARRIGAGIALGLLSWTRPEGVLIAALLLGLRAWQDRKAGRTPGQLLLAGALPYLAIVLPYEVWRITYYGYPFPNTFYAKTGASVDLLWRGLEYTWLFAISHWLLVLSMLALLLCAGAWRLLRLQGDTDFEGHKELRISLALFIVIYTLYIIVVGGDWFPGYRFFLPLLPPLTLLAVDAFRVTLHILRIRPRLAYAVGVLVALIVVSYIGGSLWQQRPEGALATRLRRESAVVENWGGAGLWLRDNTPANVVAASEAAGAIAYYSQRRVIDIFGLTDLHIARVAVAGLGLGKAGHEKGDAVYVLDRQPDYIVVSRSRRDYFASVENRISAEYTEESVLSPVGVEITWLRHRSH